MQLLVLAHGITTRSTALQSGIEHVIVEQRSADYVASRIRAGILEQVSVDLLEQAGVDQNLKEKGLPHSGIEILTNGQKFRVDLSALTQGKQVTVYGQTEVTKDLMQAREQVVFAHFMNRMMFKFMIFIMRQK